MSDARTSRGPTRRSLAPGQPVVALLAIVAGLALLTAPVLSQAPNRLVGGSPLMLVQAFGAPFAGGLVVAVALLAAAAWLPPRIASIAATLLAAASTVLLLLLAAAAANRLNAGQPPFARVALSSGGWLALVALVLALVEAQRPVRRARAGLVVVVAVAIVAGAAWQGQFDELSVVKEYIAHRGEFWGHVMRHIAIAAGGLAPALVIGLPLGLAARAGPSARWLDAALGTLQVIPAIALFALLMTPLTLLAGAVPLLRAWGIAGIGAAPAVIGLTLYLLLPIVRAVAAGLDGVDARVVDAARGMGFRPAQVLLRVEMPLAMPVILAGIRVAAVQAVGLATLAALIGGGGLGMYVFQGMGQFAADLVLLGVIPIAVLATLVDAAFRWGATLDGQGRP